MPMTLREFLAQAPERYKKVEATRRIEKERKEDEYLDAMSELIDAHPVGRPIPHGRCVVGD